MIDTIVLMLTKDKFTISDPDKFTPSARWVNNAKHALHGIQSKQNSLKRERLHGIYKPRLTLSARINQFGMIGAGPYFAKASSRRTKLWRTTSKGASIVTMLKIELSLPKLMFGNNFSELQYKDFVHVVKKLQMVLQQMGVIVSVDTLAHAHVAAIHYSKNIPLTDGSMPYHYIQKIKEANIKLSLGVNQIDYRNGGLCIIFILWRKPDEAA